MGLQAHEAGEMVAWLHSSAVARLPPAAAVESALRDGAPDAATAPPHPAVLSAAGGRLLPSVPTLLAAWSALKSRPLYRGLMEALQHTLSHARMAHAAAEPRPEAAATATTTAAAATTTAAAVAAAAAAAAAAATTGGGADEARRQGRVKAAAALLHAAQPLAEAAATCGDFVDAAREQCALLDRPLPQEPQPEEPQDAHAHAHAHAYAYTDTPEPLGLLSEAAGLSGLPDSCEAFERAEHASLRRAHEEVCASELGTRVRDWRRAMCALHAALAPHTAHLDALRTQLRWCVVHLQRLAEQLRRADGELLGAATSGGVSGDSYESAVYGRISNDGLMSTR